MSKGLLKKNKFLIVGLLIFCLLFLLASQLHAATLEVGLSYGAQTGLGTQDIRVTIARIINVFFGLLGAIAVVIILYAGFIWMTAQGVAEKIEKAKKILIGAVIGLVIALSAFAISSFIINSLIEAGGGGVCTGANCGGCTGSACECYGGQYCESGTAACSNPIPGGIEPFICSLSPTSGPKGTFVTINGANFFDFDSATSKVYFNRDINQVNTDFEAAVVVCNGQAAWQPTQIIVEVPNNLPEFGTYDVFVLNKNNTRSLSSGGLTPTNEFTLNTDELGPGICGIEPISGKENTGVNVYGKRFGTVQDSSKLVFAGGKNASFAQATDWADEHLISKVPAGAQTGDVFVKLPDKPQSNGVNFTVLCETKDDCASGCCYQTNVGKICADEDFCKPGPGEACSDKPTCSDVGCQRGLYCDQSCICQEHGPDWPCDQDKNAQNGCQKDDTLCGDQTRYYCSIASLCTCQYLPKINKVDPNNGAPGNYVTIYGQGFGDTAGQVVFLQTQADNTIKEIPAKIPTGCGASDIWQDDQVIIEVPEAETGEYGIKLTNADALTAEWDGTFTINDTVRPGLCGVDPSEGVLKTPVTLSGKNFGTQRAQALIGGTNFDNLANSSWTDAVISNLQVPNLEPAILQTQVKVGELFSNPLDFKVTVSANAPKIDYVDPAFGPVGQYITIFGSNFGTEEGSVRFLQTEGETDKTQWQLADTTFPAACKAQFWHNNYIVVKVPNLGAFKDTQVAVQTKDQIFSNAVDFTRCDLDPQTCPLRPGICKISPDQGPVGTTDVTLYGENFGDFGNQSKVIFWDKKNVTNANLSNYWAKDKIGSGMPGAKLPLTVPADAVTGPVQLVDQAGNTSNKIQFNVADCRGHEDICPGESICCPKDGVCKDKVACFGEAAPMCFYAWGFTTGKAPDLTKPPQVVEDILCAENTQSPSPWKNSNSNCVNALISARFTSEMKPSSFIPEIENGSNANVATVVVQICGTDSTFAQAACTSILPLTSITFADQTYSGQVIQNSVMLVQPQSNLVADTWYQVTLKSGPTAAIRSGSGVALDGNFDNVPGGDYTWNFRVQDSAESCALDKVVVQPNQATLKLLTETQKYSSFAFAQNCNILNGNEYDWNWYKKYTDGTKEGDQELLNNYGVAKISHNDILPQIYDQAGNLIKQGDGNNDWQQIATPKKQGLTYVGAEVFPAPDPKNKKDDNNELVVDLNIPEISRIYPDNGLIDPQVDAYVTIFGKNFGATPQNSKVLFDKVEAPLADCANAWADNMIQVKVPKSMPVGASKVSAYIQPKISEGKPGMMLFYDFQDQSNVILKDKLGSNDGEIKGPTRVSDQFGQALLFNGTSDYIKLTNNLDLKTGSLELWFKPQGSGRQTLFGASDGTAANNFSIDFDDTNKFYIVINGQESVIDNAPLKNNAWNQLVYTYDASQINFYLNGFAISSLTKSQGFLADVTGKTNVLLGAKNEAGFKNHYQGLLGSFALYDTVLTQDDVWQHFGLTNGQLLLLNFEDTGAKITDSSANQFSGLSVVDSSKMTRVSGQSGNAVKLNNTSIKITDDPALVFGKEMTIEGWFNLDSPSPVTIYEANNIKLGILSECGTDNLCFRFKVAGLGYRYAAIPLTGNFKAKAWNYFVGVYDGSNVKIYLNGQNASYSAPGQILQETNFNQACVGGCSNNFSGALDEIAVYNQALSETEIGSRIGVKDGSHVLVQTIGGTATSDQTFKYSENIYPFLCSLSPNYGAENDAIIANGANFGDSNKTTFAGAQYGVGSYVTFNTILNSVLRDEKVKDWANKVINYLNPFGDIGQPIINVSVKIDPYSEPYTDADNNGVYNLGEPYADTTQPTCAQPNDPDCYNRKIYKVENFQTKQVENLYSLQSNPIPFYLAPVITSLSPDNGPVKQWVTIKGYNFGDAPGRVYFYNNQLAQLAPCQTKTWTNNYIIVVVPDAAQSGGVYLETAKGATSNQKTFTVNNKPLGAGLCDVFTLTDKGDEVKFGTVGDTVYATGDRFGDSQGTSNLIFSNNAPAKITTWQNKNIVGTIVASSVTGDVYVLEKIEAGRACAGFHIGSFCPGGQYDVIYADVPSNSLPFTINERCKSGLLASWDTKDNGFPMETYSQDAKGNKTPYPNINVGLTASDGSYLYAMGSSSIWSNYGQPPDTVDTIYRIGTGFGSTDLGRVYKKYQYDYQANLPEAFRYDPVSNPDWGGYGYASLIATADHNLYGSLEFKSDNKWYIGKVKFNEANSTYSLEFVGMPQGINLTYDVDWVGRQASVANSNAIYNLYLASNGNNTFAMSADLPGGAANDRLGYTIQVFDLSWHLLKQFQVKNLTANNLPAGQDWQVPYYNAGGAGMVADSRNLYIQNGDFTQMIDWQKEAYQTWWPSHQYATQAYFGNYDWVNKKFWFGSLHDDNLSNWTSLPSQHNRIYSWSQCPLAGNEFCHSDDDCQACGANTSKCLNGTCSPYIANFSPVSGAIGSWVSIHGCYFGCDPGAVYFWGKETDFVGNLTGNVGYYKKGLTLSDPECGNTWRCSPDGQDEVIVEVPDKNSLPNEPNADLEHDAITGPIKLIRFDGYEDTTEHLTPSEFDVTTTNNPQICAAIPAYGNRKATVRLHGENLGASANPDDNVTFEPAQGLVREPFLGTRSTWETGDPFIDFENNGHYDDNLNKQDYTFSINNFVKKSVRDDCPANGWENNNICFAVPDKAGGYGSQLMTALDWVSVAKGSLLSNYTNFSVTFGNCGNNNIDTDKGETCDGAKMPPMTNDELFNICKELFPLESDEELQKCYSSCDNSCNLKFCIKNDCKSIIDLCGNSIVDKYPGINYVEDCDGAVLDGKSCQDKGFSSGVLACYPLGSPNNTQCTFDTSGCSNQVNIAPVKVLATLPNNKEENFCRNGIIDIYFNKLVDNATLETLTGTTLARNVKIEACSEPTFSKNEKPGLANFVVNIFKRLFGYGRQALAQDQQCTALDNDKFKLKTVHVYDGTELSLIPDNMLEPAKYYRVTLTGGDSGIKSLDGGILEGNSGFDYVFGFHTLGTAGDNSSGICNVESIQVKVYRSQYTDPATPLSERESEPRSDDLFMCAGKDTCRLQLDFDQDLQSAGNQHAYEAVGQAFGGFSLKANYKWSRTDTSDPQRALSIYNKVNVCDAGNVGVACTTNSDCGANGNCNLGDTDSDANVVKNDTGLTYVTAGNIKEALGKLVVEAQAEGSFISPVQKDFLVYILLCENPWPSINEKFPISSIINAYNFQTYYCRDAATPGGELLPAARYLLPEVNNLNILQNADFEYGDLTNWVKLTGDVFDSQPVFGDITAQRDAVPSKPQGSWWIGTRENYHSKAWESVQSGGQGCNGVGILSSQAFLIEGDQLKFRIGGGNHDWPAIVGNQLAPDGLPAVSDGVTAVTLEVREPNDTSTPAKFYVRLSATGNNSTTMQEKTFDVSQYQGKIGIIKAYDNNYSCLDNGYINFDNLRQFKQGVQIPIRF